MDERSPRVADEAESGLMQVLLVDGDGLNRYTVGKSLEWLGYVVVEASSGGEALELFRSQPFDVILSETDLPDLDGLQLLRQIKSASPDPVVILMSASASVETVVMALRYGAFDFIMKPCSNEAIRTSVERGMERAKSALRRRRMIDAIERNVLELAREEAESLATIDVENPQFSASASAKREPPDSSALTIGGLSIVPGRYQVSVDEQAASLTPTEFDLLLYLAAHRNRVVSCGELAREIRGYNTEEKEAREVIRPHVSNLRRKLKAIGAHGKLVVNVRGIGYRLGDDSESA